MVDLPKIAAAGPAFRLSAEDRCQPYLNFYRFKCLRSLFYFLHHAYNCDQLLSG